MAELRLPGRVLVRTNIDYAAMTPQAFAAQADPTLPLAFIRFASDQRVIEAFNQVFGFDFFAFRAETRRIADASLRQVRGARLTLGFAEFDEWYRDSRDEVIYPIDDDDTFHPELLSLAHPTPNAELVVWDQAAVGPAPGGFIPAVHRYAGPVLWTNNWGIKKSFLHAHFSPDEARQILSDHRAAQLSIARLAGLPAAEELGGLGPFATPLEAPFIRYLPEHFGMQYHHPGSLVMLWFYSRDGELRENLRRVELDKPVELPGALSWAEPFVVRYRELLERLAAARARRTSQGLS